MKIKIENFGPIHSFEMDLEKDMHILYGENNIGKSYAIVLVYIILKKLPENLGAGNPHELLEQYYGTLSDENPIKDVTEVAERLIFEYIGREFLSEFTAALDASFDPNSRWSNSLSKLRTRIKLDFPSSEVFLELNTNQEFIVKAVQLKHKCWVSLTGDRSNIGPDDLLFWVGPEHHEDDDLYDRAAGNPEPLTEIHADANAYFLPSSRSGLYTSMSSFAPIIASLSQHRHFISEKIELPSLSYPVAEYFLSLSTIKTEIRESPLKLISKRIEEEILMGDIEFNQATKKLEYFNYAAQVRLNLEQSSSMVAEVASIVAYLKFIVRKGVWLASQNIVLFIEEPEAHLHPKIQVKLFELFGELAKHGVKIVLTTHSNYIFNKASNMILKGELEEDKVANYHMIMTPKGSIVNPKDTLHDWGMEDENFVGVAEELYRERLEAAEENQ